jgi:putative PIN family toxin of toxin-antitoxin system
MKIVIDSSVWIAGIGSRKGFSSEIIFKSYKNNEIEIFISNQILEEISNNLEKKLNFDNPSALRAQKTVRNLCDYEAEVTEQEIKTVRIIKDNNDRHILALCKKAQADYLITFDRKHLLPIKKFGQTEILEPRDFVEKL